MSVVQIVLLVIIGIGCVGMGRIIHSVNRGGDHPPLWARVSFIAALVAVIFLIFSFD